MKRHLWKNAIRKRIRQNHIMFDGADVKKALKSSILKKMSPWLLDKTYKVVDEETMLNIVERSKLDRREYVPEHFDCDEFAKVFWGSTSKDFELNSTGMVLDMSSAHAYTVLLVHKLGKLVFLAMEPQSDKIITAPTQNHKMLGGYIIM